MIRLLGMPPGRSNIDQLLRRVSHYHTEHKEIVDRSYTYAALLQLKTGFGILGRGRLGLKFSFQNLAVVTLYVTLKLGILGQYAEA
jgi:hypothetical protein